MRCKACQHIMEPEEIVWYPERGEHEELCRKCLRCLIDCGEIVPVREVLDE